MRVIGMILAAVLWVGTGVGQQAPTAAPAPKGATGQCSDGTYTQAAKKWQACGGHKGVKSWFADAAGTPGAAASSKPASTATSTAKPSGSATGPAAKAAATQAAPGGGPGMVWVNVDSKVYHCPGGTFYGKTKNGKYMSEADAQKMGAKPDHGKACGKS